MAILENTSIHIYLLTHKKCAKPHFFGVTGIYGYDRDYYSHIYPALIETIIAIKSYIYIHVYIYNIYMFTPKKGAKSL